MVRLNTCYCDIHRLPQFYKVLQDPYPKDNIWLISDTQETIAQYSSTRGLLILNYILNHVQIAGNEKADDLVNEGTRIEEV